MIALIGCFCLRVCVFRQVVVWCHWLLNFVLSNPEGAGLLLQRPVMLVWFLSILYRTLPAMNWLIWKAGDWAVGVPQLGKSNELKLK